MAFPEPTIRLACEAKFSRLLGQCNNLLNSRNQTITAQTCKTPGRKCKGKVRAIQTAIQQRTQNTEHRTTNNKATKARNRLGKPQRPTNPPSSPNVSSFAKRKSIETLCSSTRSHIVWLIAGKVFPVIVMRIALFPQNFFAPIGWQRLSDRTGLGRALKEELRHLARQA